MKKLIAGNWKMNGTVQEARDLALGVVDAVDEAGGVLEKCELLLCPPFIHISVVQEIVSPSGNILLGAQDCAKEENGAYTGDVSAEMLKDAGCFYVILGHSERRSYHFETSLLVSEKAKKAHQAGLTTIICVGETEDDRATGIEKEIVLSQLEESLPSSASVENIVIAYEPVWAIGTGKTATPEDVGAMHNFIREKLSGHFDHGEKIRILYGGSMKPDNAGALLAVPHVDGGLIGGASLDVNSFMGIASAA